MTYRNAALSNTAVAVKGVYGAITALHVFNGNNADSYLQIYDAAQGDVVVGTTTPRYTLWIPAFGSHDIQVSKRMLFQDAITIAATTTATGGTAPSTGLLVNVEFE